jgi:hypothetical protein
MLRILTRHMRRRVGRLVALVYIICVIAPPVSLAFTDGAVAAHCLSEDHHAPAVTHVHTAAADAAKPHDHATHEHAMHDHAMAGHAGHDHAMPTAEQKPADPSDTNKQDHKIVGGCCGLFCMTTATADMGVAIGIAPRGSILQPVLEPATVGHEPDRIDRPPISLASL